MRKLSILSLALLTLSLTKSAKVNDDVKKPDDLNKMMTENEQKETKNGVDLMEIMSQCNDTFRIEMAYLEALNESGSFPDETDRTPKCFIRCMLEQTGIASEEGAYDAARAAAVLPAQRGDRTVDVQPMATTCAVRTESCKCERAYQFMKCLMEMEIQMYDKGQ